MSSTFDAAILGLLDGALREKPPLRPAPRKGRRPRLILHGERLEGRYAIFRTGGTNWLVHLMKEDGDPGH